MVGLCAHADGNELVAWMRQMRQAPAMTYVGHGEPDASDPLRLRIRDELGRPARVPQHAEVVET